MSLSRASWVGRSMPSATVRRPEVVGQVDDGRHQEAALLAAAELVHELLVDLQHVDRELAQPAERRVAGAEVVDARAGPPAP